MPGHGQVRSGQFRQSDINQYFITTELMTADARIKFITTKLVTVDSVLLFPIMITIMVWLRVILEIELLHTIYGFAPLGSITGGVY